MQEQTRLKQVDCAVAKALIRDYKSNGFTVYSISKAIDSEQFFRHARVEFPLDPPISGNVHWDAFADSIWGGLDGCIDSKIVLVIEDATEFAQKSPGDFGIAIDCMTTAAQEVETEKRSEGNADAQIRIVVGVD